MDGPLREYALQKMARNEVTLRPGVVKEVTEKSIVFEVRWATYNFPRTRWLATAA